MIVCNDPKTNRNNKVLQKHTKSLMDPLCQVLARVLPLVAALGLDRLFLVGAAKTEPAYLASHYFLPRNAGQLRCLLRLGLEQAGHLSHLPRVTVHRRLDGFLRDLDVGAFDGDGDADGKGDADGGGGGGGGETEAQMGGEAPAGQAGEGRTWERRWGRHQRRGRRGGGTAPPLPPSPAGPTAGPTAAAAVAAGEPLGAVSWSSAGTLRAVAHPTSAFLPRTAELAPGGGGGGGSSSDGHGVDGPFSGASSGGGTCGWAEGGGASGSGAGNSGSLFGCVGGHSLGSVPFPTQPRGRTARILLAVGPDGGWEVGSFGDFSLHLTPVLLTSVLWCARMHPIPKVSYLVRVFIRAPPYPFLIPPLSLSRSHFRQRSRGSWSSSRRTVFGRWGSPAAWGPSRPRPLSPHW